MTSASTRLSPIRPRTRSIRAGCEISSKQALISPSSTHSYVLDARKRLSAIASCARRPGRKPYEHGTKSASKIGSSTSFRDACTTRSATVGMPRRRRLRVPGLGIIRSLTGSGRNLRDLSCSRSVGQEGVPADLLPDGDGGLPVDSGRARTLVPRYPIPGHHQETGISDEVKQIVEPTMRIVARPAVQPGLDLQYPPLSPERASRQITRIHQRSPGLPALPLLTCWPPSPCGRLSRPRTTTGPPPRPVPSADDVPALPACWPHAARAAPAGSHVHRKADRRVRRPALPLRHRHGYAAGIHHGLPAGVHMPAREFPATRRQRVRTAPSPYPPDLSWWAVKGRQALVPLVHLPVSLAGPAPSGSTSTFRHCQGCSRPPRRLPDQAALSFTRPLRRPGGKGLSPPLDLRRLVAHMGFRPVHPNKDHLAPLAVPADYSP